MIVNIAPGNSSLAFIEKRIADDNYRGTASSQHNRYNMSELFDTLTILEQYTKNGPLQIRDTDSKKRPENTPGEYEYAKFTNEVKRKIGQGSQDSIRKNRFPDWAVMGFINRYNAKMEPVGLNAKKIKYVDLTDEGKAFIHEPNIENRLFVYTKGVYIRSPQISYILEILRNPDFGIDVLTEWEIMFFVSAIDTDTSFSISISEAVDLIKDWKNGLTPLQKNSVICKLRDVMKPENYKGNKVKKRDFHNWKNKIDQIYYLLQDNAYFHIDGEKMSLSTRIDKNTGVQIIKKRSVDEQNAYYREHGVKKRKNSDLHHIVALMFAENVEQYHLYDKWQNMIEVRGDKHHLIGRKYKNMIFKLSAEGDDLVLSDYNDNSLVLKYDEDINYNPEKQDVMLQYNRELLATM